MRRDLDAEGRQLASQVSGVRVARLTEEQLGADGQDLGGADGSAVRHGRLSVPTAGQHGGGATGHGSPAPGSGKAS